MGRAQSRSGIGLNGSRCRKSIEWVYESITVRAVEMGVLVSKCCIYVLLLGEGIDVWRPVRAIELSQSRFRILESAGKDPGEVWEFNEGDTV